MNAGKIRHTKMISFAFSIKHPLVILLDMMNRGRTKMIDPNNFWLTFLTVNSRPRCSRGEKTGLLLTLLSKAW